MANHKKTQKKRKPSRPLPKVGSAKDDAYRLKHSREDVADFGLGRGRGGVATWIIFAVIIFLVVAGLIGWIAIT